MGKDFLTRRAFLGSVKNSVSKSIILLSTSAIVAACRDAKYAKLSGTAFKNLSETEASEFNAIAGRILPSTATPGAKEAGVVYFLDTVLDDSRSAEFDALKKGLQELRANASDEFNASNFSSLNEAQQDLLLRQAESTAFFSTMRYLTIAGMFALPEYGGNRDSVGYDLMGFDDRHSWFSPYGFYDADYIEKGE